MTRRCLAMALSLVVAMLGLGGLPAHAAVLPASISMSFGAPRIPLNGSTSLSFSVSNPNPGSGLTSISFNDTLPAFLVVSTPNGASDDCSGTLTAMPGSSSVTYSGGSVGPHGFCLVSVNVTGTVPGEKDNSVTVSSGPGQGNTSNASVLVFEAAGFADEPRVGMDGSGNAVAVWHRSDNLYWRTQDRGLSAGGGLSAAQDLSAAGQDAWAYTQTYTSGPAQLAVDPKGAAEIVWARYDGANWRIQARHRSASGSLGPVKTLSTSGQNASQPQVAMDPHGDALVVWTEQGGAVQSAFRSSAGTWGPVKTLSNATQYGDEPQVAMDGNGNAMVTWEQFDGSVFTVKVVRRSASGTWGQVKTPSPSNSDNPALAMNSSGDAVLVWAWYDGAHTHVQVRSRSTSGQWSTTQTLTPSGSDSDYYPQVAVDAKGKALMAWAMQGPCYCIQAQLRSASGHLGTRQTLDGSQAQAQPPPQVAMDPQGDAVVTWYEDLISGLTAQARRLSAAGTWGARQDVDANSTNTSAPGVAIDPKGTAVLVWTNDDTSTTYPRVQARRWPLGGGLGPVKTLSPPG
jgi:hypothetical protein